jgi:uncharacterized protein (DUF983 family)
MKQDAPPVRSYFSAVFRNKCPRCREGDLFRHRKTINLKKNLLMHDRCPVCGQPTDLEVGFYYGTGYVSYLICLFLSAVSFLLWWLLIGFSFSDNRFVVWIVLNSVFLIALQPWLMRFSRSLWISCFVKYDPEWPHTPPQDGERIVREQMNNW